MNTFFKQVLRLAGFAVASTGIAAGSLALTHYTGIYDATPIFDWLRVSGDSVAAVGTSLSTATVMGIGAQQLVNVVLRTVAGVRTDVDQSMVSVLDRVSTVEQKQNEIATALKNVYNAQLLSLTYDQTMALKNLDSTILTEESKEQLRQWLLATSNSVTQLNSPVPATIQTISKTVEDAKITTQTVQEIISDVTKIAQGMM
jgi:prophage DNA circulation protein